MSKSQEKRFFEITVGFGALGTTENSPLGTWSGLADDADHGKGLALDSLWDHRLDAGDASPRFHVEEKPRYVASPGWGHIFVGDREETTRWVYDRATKALVTAQVLNGAAWIALDAAPMADLVESIHDNDAIDNPDDFQLVESRDLLTWEEIAAIQHSVQALRALCEKTETSESDWHQIDGPETGVGNERWYRHKDGREAYTVDDQGSVSVDVSCLR